MDQSLLEGYLQSLKKTLRESGIKTGNVLYVASDLAGVVVDARKDLQILSEEDRVRFCDGIVNALQELVGADGQLLVPVFTWTFCAGTPFDYRKTKGEVGILGNHILFHRTDFARTAHPLYSFMVWGRDTEMLCRMQNQDSWGRQSPFAYLHRIGAKQLNINVSCGAVLGGAIPISQVFYGPLYQRRRRRGGAHVLHVCQRPGYFYEGVHAGGVRFKLWLRQACELENRLLYGDRPKKSL